MAGKKSFWAFAMASMLFVPAMLVLTACGEHKHTYSENWSRSETQHWYACTGKDCDEKKDLENHEFVWTEKKPASFHENKVEEGICSKCNLKVERTIDNSATHTFDTTMWQSDESGHWHKSTCDETEPTHQSLQNDFAEHTYGTWTVKTPADFHKNKIESRICSVCGFEDTKEVPDTMEHTWTKNNDNQNHWEETTCTGHEKLIRNKETHTWESKTDDTNHWEQTTCTQHEAIKRNEEAHTWNWKCNDVYDWEETICTQHNIKERNKTGHTWVYTSEGELTHRRTSNCGAEKHSTRIDPNIPHRYDNVNDTTCNDCDYVRDLTGKGRFVSVSTRTYNAGEQGVEENEYEVNEAIKSLCKIQYKVKGADDSTYTTTTPTNAGTYEVRIYCEGNATYLQGEVAKTDFVINKYKVEIVKKSSFKVAYDKAAMDDTNVQYIHLGTVHVNEGTEGLVKSVDVPIKAPKIKLSKNPGRKQVDVEDLLTEDDNFAIKELPSSDALRKATIVHYDDSVVATLTSYTIDKKPVIWDETKVGITVTRVNNGTIRVGDYMMCEGYTKPLKVVALKLEHNVPTDMLVNADKNCEIYFDNSSFADLATAKPILANKIFTKVETLNFVEGKNYTNTVSRQLGKGECFYLAFTTETSTYSKTYKVNFDTDGTGYETSGSVYFFGTDGYTDTSGIELNVMHEELYFVKVTKTADSKAGKESVNFNITKR